MMRKRLCAALATIVSVAVLAAPSAGADDTAAEVAARCPRVLPSTSLKKLYNNTCYHFVQEEKYWPDAKDFCLQHAAKLVKIDEPGVNSFILKALSELWWNNNGIWIGLNDRNREQVWEWTGYREGQTERLARWTNWAPSHPGPFLHEGRDCVKMVRNRGEWKWEETYCSVPLYKYRFICQYRAKPQETTVAAVVTTAVAEETKTTKEATTELLEEATTEDGQHILPVLGEIRSELKEMDKSTVGILLIIAGCGAACLFILVSACLVFRYRKAKKQESLDFSALDKKYVVGTAYPPTIPNPAYANRPVCPLPCSPEISEICTPGTYYSLAREEPLRAESNIYLNATSASYCPMSQSTSSINKLPPPPANPVSRTIYATPALRYHPQDSIYNSSTRSDEYLCPSVISRRTGIDVTGGYDVMGTESDAIGNYDVMGTESDVMDGHDVTGDNTKNQKQEQTTYDQPKALNVYSEIPEAFYNNVYEALKD